MDENKYYTLLDNDNRIVMVTAVQQEPEQFLFDYPTGFDFSAIHDYKILDGELIHDPVPVPEPPEPQPTTEERLSLLEDYSAELLFMICEQQLGIDSEFI